MSIATRTIILVGPVPAADGSNVGGATRSFGQLIEFLAAESVPHVVVNTQAIPGTLAKVQHVRKAVKAAAKPGDIVFLNTSQNGIRTLGPILHQQARKRGWLFVARPFGSGFQQLYQEAGAFVQAILKRTVLRADMLFLQTQRLMDFFEPMAQNLRQLPTSRIAPEAPLKSSFTKRFCFIGQVSESKGAQMLLAALEYVDASYTVSLYGPIVDQQQIAGSPNYKGMLQSADAVWRTLQQYDVLVLPTKYEGEGYPGVIVEAYAMGLPVISSDWLAIPEIVQPGKTGFLIDPQAPDSAKKLAQAMQSFTPDNYVEMSRNARALFEQRFEANAVMKRMLDELNALT